MRILGWIEIHNVPHDGFSMSAKFHCGFALGSGSMQESVTFQTKSMERLRWNLFVWASLSELSMVK